MDDADFHLQDTTKPQRWANEWTEIRRLLTIGLEGARRSPVSRPGQIARLEQHLAEVDRAMGGLIEFMRTPPQD